MTVESSFVFGCVGEKCVTLVRLFVVVIYSASLCSYCGAVVAVPIRLESRWSVVAVAAGSKTHTQHERGEHRP